jgi:hypothetical protein
MSDFTNALVRICNEELARFDGGARRETDDPQFRFVGEYWASIGKELNGRTVVHGKRPAWSAAFISFVVRKAGAGDRFFYAEAHCHYTNKAMLLADGTNNGHGYVAHRPPTYAPKVGDIIVAGREYARAFDYDQARLIYLADSFYPSHGDVVVARSPGRIETIGGNVSRDTVGKRQRRLNADGTLQNLVESGREYPWIAVLECLL